MKFLYSVLLAVACHSVNAGPVKLTRFVGGLINPVHITVAPGEPGVYYIVEQPGKIKRFANGETTTFLDLTDSVVFSGEAGVLSLAFHPNYQENGRYFVAYSVERPDFSTLIAEFKRGESGETEILRIPKRFYNHNGGQVAFDAQGYLYFGMGDGGGGGDPDNNGQNRNSLLGKILRLDVDHGSPYAIPADNPFAQGGGRGEIYAWGLRNPWRFSFDRVTGKLFAGDVGQNAREEIDIIEKGNNFGWRTMEGFLCFNPQANCDRTGLTLPIFDYPRTEGISITGGFVYRGSRIPSLVGKYIYADFSTKKIWALNYDQEGKKVLGNELLLTSGQAVSSFGEDADGELFVVGHQGTVFRMEPQS